MNRNCPHAEQVLAFRRLVERVLDAELEQTFSGMKTDNPIGLLVVTYCRDCDCSLTLLYEPDGPTGSSVRRAAAACRVADTKLRIELGGFIGKNSSSEEN